MNREIKFIRYWFTDAEKTQLHHKDTWGKDIDGSAFKSPSSNNVALYFTDCQFTGLKDKVGKEVFEGVVYRDEFSVSDEHGVDTRIYFVCAYVKSMSAFCWISNSEYVLGIHNYDHLPEDMELYYTVNSDDVDTKVIIGNIFENPDLLTKD